MQLQHPLWMTLHLHSSLSIYDTMFLSLVVNLNICLFQQRTNLFMDKFNGYLSERTNGLVEVAFAEIFNVGLIEDNLDHLITKDVKIVVAFVGEKDAVDMLCKASQTGLTTSEYVWILPSYSDPDWWRRSSNCTQNELKLALESTLFILPTKYPPFTQANMVCIYY